MPVTVKALRPLSELIGSNNMQIEWVKGTLEDLVCLLIDKTSPEVEGELKAEDGSIAYAVSVNGKIQRGLSTPIQDGDEISFFFPIGGG